MNASVRAAPSPLPSREAAARAAAEALDAGSPVLVIGDPGSGRSAFASRLLADAPGAEGLAHRLTGARALREVPFAALAALAAQVPEGFGPAPTPVEMIAGLGRLADGAPRWIALDRAEHVDEESAAVFAQLVDSGACRLIVTARGVSALPDALRRLAGSPGTHRVELGPITVDDAQTLLDGLMEAPVNRSTVARLHEASAGNPLFLRELGLDARAAGALRPSAGYWTLAADWAPRGGRTAELAAQRLSEQPGQVRDAVETLALTGELPLALALRLISRDALDQACDAGLCEASRGRSPRAGLGAGLSPQLVVASLDDARLRELVRRLDERLPREQLEPRTRVALALQAMRVGLEADAARTCEDAAAAAHARHFHAVVALTEQVATEPAEGADEAARSLARSFAFLRSAALNETGRPRDALQVLESRVALGDPEARSAAALVRGLALGEVEPALDLLAPLAGDPPAVAALRLVLESRVGRPVDPRALRAVADDAELGTELRFAASAAAMHELVLRGRPVDAGAEARAVMGGELWGGAHPTARGLVLAPLAHAGMEDDLGDAETATRFEGVDWGTLSYDHAAFMAGSAARAYDRGAVGNAYEALRQALALLEIADPQGIAGYTSGYAASCAALLGQDVAAAELLARHRASPPESGQHLAADARRAALTAVALLDGPDVARDELEGQLAHASARGRALVRLRLLHDAWRLRLRDDPAELSAAARDVQGSHARVLAGYADALRPGSEGLDALELLVRAHLATGRGLYAAELAARGSELARSRGDRARASHLLARSAEASPPALGIASPSLGRARIDPAVLTERELDICVRAADGASNHEIAERLFLSPRTVEGHLQRAYAKLGVSDRRQLLPRRDPSSTRGARA